MAIQSSTTSKRI